jgi:hypothetical protein
MNYFTYIYKLSKLKCKRKYFERSILKDVEEARKNGNKEKLEELYTLLNANNINYKKFRYKLMTRYFSLQY